MKLRLNHDAARIRVYQDDLNRFWEKGRVAATTHIAPSATFTYALVVDPDVARPTAELKDATLTVRVPRALAETWATTDRVGFEAEQNAGPGHTLHLLVEKDVGCQHKDGRSEQAFAHLSDRT